MYFIDNFSQEGTGPNQPKRRSTSETESKTGSSVEISQPVFSEREVVPQTEPTPRKCTGTKDIM